MALSADRHHDVTLTNIDCNEWRRLEPAALRDTALLYLAAFLCRPFGGFAAMSLLLCNFSTRSFLLFFFFCFALKYVCAEPKLDAAKYSYAPLAF